MRRCSGMWIRDSRIDCGYFFFFSSRRRHTRCLSDWSSDVCSSDLRLIVSILRNDAKEPLFSVEERRAMLAEVIHVYPNVEVDSFNGLLVDHAAAREATVLLRGIRAISDYEYELQMALMNRRLRPDIETVFMMANEAYSFISSRLVKEVYGLGGNISGL